MNSISEEKQQIFCGDADEKKLIVERILDHHFRNDDAIIWYSLHKNKIKCYTELCRLCALEYFQLEKSAHRNNTLNCPNDNLPSVVCYHETSTDSKSKHVFNSILSPTISKALVDRFIKDPTKFSGEKDNIITWFDEIE
ncbi:unnamed protein product [Rotaria sordida]|uniref:Uncharacterized protein n=1 Tax=Rotaria sordida TaxID=392033 RepID=A0A814G3K4_9BILA|nr:unnamed protein product [Rotaria sordida]